MARLSVTTDDGTVIELWADPLDDGLLPDSINDIGNLASALNRVALREDIFEALRRARRIDRRDADHGFFNE